MAPPGSSAKPPDPKENVMGIACTMGRILQKSCDFKQSDAPLDYCDMKLNGTLADHLAAHPEEAEAAAAYIAQFCPDIIITLPCDMTLEELAAFVDANPDSADETLAIMQDECPECDTINWLRGYISARDEGFIPPSPVDPDDPTQNKITICHVSGQAGSEQRETLTLDWHAVYGEGGHFNENGTPRAGHEQDTLGPCDDD
jgi:hypothetical protein